MAAVEAQSSSPVSSAQSDPDTVAVVGPAQPQQPRFLQPGDVVNNHPISLPQGGAIIKDVANAKPATTSAPPKVPAASVVPKKRKSTSKKDATENKVDKKPKEPKEKKTTTTTRKPRTVDPNKPTAASRKKQKTDVAAAALSAGTPREPAPSRELKLHELLSPGTTQMPSQQVQPTQVKREDLSGSALASRPASSGQRFDPIRSMYVPKADTTPKLQDVTRQYTTSPSISSLMNPMSVANAMSSPPTPQPTKAPKPPVSLPTAYKKEAPAAAAAAAPTTSLQDHPMPAATTNGVFEHPRPAEQVSPKPAEKEKEKPVTKPAAAAAKPKKTSPPPARPTGSGLLSNSDLFGGPSAAVGEDDRVRHGVDIDIEIPLDPAGYNTINIAQEIVKKYGRDAVNPRAAAHRERLLRIAHMGARFEGTEDVMSVDAMSSGDENDSNVEMGGMNDDNNEENKSETGAKPKKRVSRRKVEEYDKDDGFVDDTELAWQEQAAVAQDGFFVYSGPIDPAAEVAKAERCVFSFFVFLPDPHQLTLSLPAPSPQEEAKAAAAAAEAKRPQLPHQPAPHTHKWPRKPRPRTPPGPPAVALRPGPRRQEERVDQAVVEAKWLPLQGKLESPRRKRRRWKVRRWIANGWLRVCAGLRLSRDNSF